MRIHRTRATSIVLHLAGIGGLAVLLWAALETGRWIFVPLALLLFWPVFLSDREIHERDTWPLLFRYPLEIAGLFVLLALAYVGIAGRWDHRSWGMLGGTLASVACALRGNIEDEERGDSIDGSLHALSRYALARRWVMRNSRIRFRP